MEETEMTNTFNIERTFKIKAERKWDMLYVAIDLHGTLIKPYHETIEFYPDAVEVIKWFNDRTDFKVILWTSSYWHEVKKFLVVSESKGIRFDFVNENPLEANSGMACFNKKFYFNILLDDKAGFVGETDWTKIKTTLINLDVWKENKTNMKKQCAVYIGQLLTVEVWRNGRQPDVTISYGMTGKYNEIDGTFIPDDAEIPKMVLKRNQLYFPKTF